MSLPDKLSQQNLINPLEFNAGIKGIQSLYSSFMGNQLVNDPSSSVFLESEFGGRFLSKEEYLTQQFEGCRAIYQNFDHIPPVAQQYYAKSQTFNAIFDHFGQASNDKILGLTERFLLDHGEKCKVKLDEFELKVEGYRKAFEVAVSDAVKNDDLPGQALVNLAMLEKISFGLTDASFSAYQPDDFIGGFYDPNHQTVALSFFLDDESLKKVFYHEAVHVIAGHTIVNKFGVSNQVIRSGFPQQNMEGAEWLDEALTEHVALSLLSGGFKIVDFAERLSAGIEDLQDPYKTERRILHTLTAGRGLGTMLKLYFTHREEGSTEYQKAFRAFVHELNGYNISHLLRRYNEALNKMYAGQTADAVFGPDHDVS